MITTALSDRALPVYGDGKEQRDWLHVEEICRGILAVLEKGKIREVYIIGALALEENLTMARRILRLARRSESLLSQASQVTGEPNNQNRSLSDGPKDSQRC